MLKIKIHSIYTLIENNKLAADDIVDSRYIRIYIESEGTDPVYTSNKIESNSGKWVAVNELYRSSRIPTATNISIEIMNGENRVYTTQLKLSEFSKTHFFKNDENRVNLAYFPIFIEEYSNGEYFDIIPKDNHKPIEYKRCEIDTASLNEHLKALQN